MVALPSAGGLIAILEGEVVPSLRRIAKNRSMPLLEAEAAEQVFRNVLRLRPRVIIVQVGQLLDEALELIRLLASATPPMRLIAAATQHTAEIEQAVRGAGATYYLPGTEVGPVDQLLDAVLMSSERS